MTQVTYDLAVLGGGGSGYGVNDFGEVVGNSSGPAIWMPYQPPWMPYPPPLPPFGAAESAGALLKVDNFGNAVGILDSKIVPYYVVNGTSLIANLESLGR
jgi:hypothetical protein